MTDDEWDAFFERESQMTHMVRTITASAHQAAAWCEEQGWSYREDFLYRFGDGDSSFRFMDEAKAIMFKLRWA